MGVAKLHKRGSAGLDRHFLLDVLGQRKPGLQALPHINQAQTGRVAPTPFKSFPQSHGKHTLCLLVMLFYFSAQHTGSRRCTGLCHTAPWCALSGVGETITQQGHKLNPQTTPLTCGTVRTIVKHM